MRSIFLVLSVCGAVSHASECQAADEASLLQSRVVHTYGKGKKAWLKTLRDVAESLTEGSGTTKTADEVHDALSAAGEALAQLSPAIRNQIEVAQQQINDATSAVQACHGEAAATRRAHLQTRVDQRAAAVESCEADLEAANAAEEEACTRAEDCLCDEARAHATDQAALCASVSDTYEGAFCEHHLACTMHQECHADEMQVYLSLRSDVEEQMAALEQEYIATEQASCLTALIMEAMTPPITPISHAALIACDDVDVSVLAITHPQVPSEPAACPESAHGDVQCGEPACPTGCTADFSQRNMGGHASIQARVEGENVGNMIIFHWLNHVYRKMVRVPCDLQHQSIGYVDQHASDWRDTSTWNTWAEGSGNTDFYQISNIECAAPVTLPPATYVRGGQDGSCPAGSTRVSIEECPEMNGMTLSDGTMGTLSNSRHRVDCARHFVHGAGCFVNIHSNVYSTAENCPQAQGIGHNHWAICKTAR